ncbi:MAG TPA: glycosyltransferase family 39 protein [Polyangia bacterium]|nr:glycosyltransferase family 39 protein [Polyangia bacterium]
MNVLGAVRARLDLARPAGRRPELWLIALVAAVYLLLYFHPPGGQVTGDGHYSWVMARSLAFDGDLQLANDYALCGDPWHQGVDQGGGRPANGFYIGPALVWTPVLAFAHAVVPLPIDAPAAWRSGCAGPWVTWTLTLGPLAGVLTAWLGYRFARRWASARASQAAMLANAFATGFVHFATINVSYSHVWTAGALGLALLGWLRAIEAPARRSRWLLAGVGFGAAALMRPQSALFVLAPLALLLFQAVRRPPAQREPLALVVPRALLLLAGFLALFWIQLWANHVLYGRLFPFPLGARYVQLGHPRPFALLFGGRGGMLSWHPVLWLALIGVALQVARRPSRPFWLALTLPMVLEFYLDASVDWHASAAFGARRLTVLTVPFVAAMAVCGSALWARVKRWPNGVAAFATLGWLLPVTLQNIGASEGVSLGNIPTGQSVDIPRLLGRGITNTFGALYVRVGNPFALPATLPFSMRYRLPPARWDMLTNGGYFDVVPGTTRIQRDTFDLAADYNAPFITSDFVRVADGAALAQGARGRIVVELAWWHVTHVTIEARTPSASPATVRLRNNLMVFGHDLGAFTVTATGTTIELPVPTGAFTTGINELVFEADDAPVVIQKIRWRDSALSP